MGTVRAAFSLVQSPSILSETNLPIKDDRVRPHAREAIAGVAQTLRRAEAVSIAGIRGTASTQEVVEKIMAAEQSLQAAIAVRDKVVSAYTEISRMAI